MLAANFDWAGWLKNAMHIGHYISGGAHAGLIFWALFGGMFRPEPIPFEVANVSVISSAEFDAINEAYQAPLVDTSAQVLLPTDVSEAAPEVSSAIDQTTESVAPPARPDQNVEVTRPQPPEPLDQPEIVTVIPDQPKPPQPTTTDLPVTAPTAARVLRIVSHQRQSPHRRKTRSSTSKPKKVFLWLTLVKKPRSKYKSQKLLRLRPQRS